MIAIDMEMPESCCGNVDYGENPCPFKEYVREQDTTEKRYYRLVTKKYCERMDECVDDYTDRRHPDCPLMELQERSLPLGRKLYEIGEANNE